MRKLILLLSILNLSLAAFAQDKKIIAFKQEKLTTHPRYFRIIGVKDSRPDTTTIGSVRAGLFSKKSVSLDLPGGAASALEKFIHANLLQDSQSIPVSLHITELEIAQSTGGLKAEAELRLTVSFYGGESKLVEYKGGESVKASLDATKYSESMIRLSLDNILGQFDQWLSNTTNQQQVKAALNGPAVQAEVVFKTTTDDSDWIAWSAGRPLNLDDFQAPVDPLSRAAAATGSGIGLQVNQQTVFGQTRLVVTITPFFDKTKSWCQPTSRTNATLLHEQRHFDITFIKACELASEIRSYPFTPANYTNELQQLYRQKEKEVQQQQDRYDRETQHGTLTPLQDKWEQAIRDSSSRQPCYHP